MPNLTPVELHLQRMGWLVVSVLIAGILLPFLTAWGMFLDGVTYAAISRNLALGLGHWWKPYYTAMLHPEFYEHPPLGFIIQSVFFTVLGDHYLVEKVYCLSMMLLSLGLIVFVWHQLTRQCTQPASPFFYYAWLPVLLWITLPRWQWAYKNNLLENTLTVFCLLSFACSLKALDTQQIFRRALYACAAGLMVVAALLTKGPTGLFPLTAPLLYIILVDSKAIRSGVSVTLLCVFFALALFGFLLLYEPVWINLNHYLSDQLLPSLTGQRWARSAETSRLSFLYSMGKELALHSTLAGLLLLFARYGGTLSLPPAMLRKAGACFVIALSGSLPILLSYKQRSFYIIPTLPFFALAFGLLLRPSLAALLRQYLFTWKEPAFRLFYRIGGAALLCIILVSLFLINTPYRDGHVFRGIRAIGRVVPVDSIVGIHPSEWDGWGRHAHLQRYLQISLDGSATARDRTFYLHPVNDRDIPQEFEPTGVRLRKTLLLRKKSL